MKTVYLDSQDFSHFSARHKDHARYAALKSELLQLKREGKARFVFSDVHIYEVFPKNGHADAEGLDRIRTLAEFCGRDSLPSFSSLLEHEVASELSKRRGRPIPSLSENWFPDIGMRDQPFERPERLNRSQRRALGAKVNHSELAAAVEDARKNLPFLKSPDILLKYFLHKVGWDEVVSVIEESIQDIENFSSYLISSYDHGLDMPGILRRGYDSYVNAMTAMKSEVSLRAVAAIRDEDRSGLTENIHRELARSTDGFRASIVRELMSDLDGYDPAVDVVHVDETMPSFDALVRYLAELIRRSAQISMPRKPAGSDLADALHVSYFPRVSLFRTDMAAADVLRRLYPNRKEDIINDVFQLPGRILGSA